MATIVTRAGKGSPLTNTELDSNFSNLNTDKLELSGGTLTGNLSLGDNVKAQFGSATDLSIYSDGTNSYIQEGSGTSGIRITTDNQFLIRKHDTENIAAFNVDGAVRFYHDNAQKFSTTSYGIDITGRLVTTSHIDAPDNARIRLGDGDDLQLYHDGNDSYIKDAGTGDLYIQGEANVRITDGDGNKMFLGQNDAEVQLYYNGSEKFHTTNTGVNVLGSVVADGLTVDGVSQFDNYGGATGKGRIQFGNSGQQFIEGLDTGNGGSGSYLKFGYGSTDALTINSSGSVGIGTNNSRNDTNFKTCLSLIHN